MLQNVFSSILTKSDDAKRPCFRYIDVDGVIETNMTTLLTALYRIAKEHKALRPLSVSADMRQRPMECITQARSYSALFQLAGAITGKGFQRNEQLENHIRRKHPNDGDNLERCLKKKADVDWDESLQDIKRLREDTRDLSN